MFWKRSIMLSGTKRFFSRGLVAAALLACGAAHADLVSNGGFESGDFTDWSATTDAAYDGVDGNAPHEGSYAAFFGNPFSVSTLTQSVATVAGATYKISFWLQLEADVTGASGLNSFEADFGSTVGSSFVDAAAFGYTLIEFLATATSSSTDLTFRFNSTPGFWDIDSIQVALPEPGSLALLAAAGLSGIAATRRRKSASHPA